MTAIEQIKLVDPSVPGALYRLLQREETVSYLREDEGIYGFEVNHDSRDLSGFSIIAIKKHTLLAYKSDLGMKPRLILFPSMSVLFDDAFELLDLDCKKIHITNESFKGKVVKEGRLQDLVRDLTPPMKQAPDISDDLSEQILRVMTAGYNDVEIQDKVAAKPKFQGHVPQQKIKHAHETIRTETPKPVIEVRLHPVDALKEQSFTSIDQVIQFCVVNYEADEGVLRKLESAIMDKSSELGPAIVDGFVSLTIKCFEQRKIAWRE